MAAHRTGDIEAYIPSPTRTHIQEKDLLAHQLSDRTTTRAPRGTFPATTMPAPVRLLFALLVCFLVSFGLAAAWLPDAPHSPEQHVEPAPAAPDSTISHILKAVSPGSLHDALHRYLPGYQHGVYESDSAALEAVHREHAALAAAVVQHLARRDNTTTSSTLPPPPPPVTSSTTSLPTSSTNPPPTSSSTSIPTPTTSAPTSTLTSASSTPQPTSSDPTSSSRSRRPVTSTFTSNVNGVPVVVTATQYVDGDLHESASQTRPPGSLHTDAAAGVRRDLGLVFAGAIGALGVLLA